GVRVEAGAAEAGAQSGGIQPDDRFETGLAVVTEDDLLVTSPSLEYSQGHDGGDSFSDGAGALVARRPVDELVPSSWPQIAAESPPGEEFRVKPADGQAPSGKARSGWTAGSCAGPRTRASRPS